MTGRRRAVVLIAAGLVATACGGGGDNGEAGKSAEQILADAVAALRGTQSFHVTGQENAAAGGATPSALGNIALSLDVAGPSTARGTLNGNGFTASFVVTGGKFYIQGKQFFAKVAGAQAAELIGDRWVVAPTSAGFGGFDQFIDSHKLADCLSLDHGTLSKGGESTVNGQTVVVLVDKGEKPGTQAARISIAASGTAYPLKYETTAAAQPGTPPGGAACGNSADSSTGAVLFSDFGASYSVSAPKDALDLQTLLGGGG